MGSFQFEQRAEKVLREVTNLAQILYLPIKSSGRKIWAFKYLRTLNFNQFSAKILLAFCLKFGQSSPKMMPSNSPSASTSPYGCIVNIKGTTILKLVLLTAVHQTYYGSVFPFCSGMTQSQHFSQQSHNF